MNARKSTLPVLFKGIALFTPGGDSIYCVDPSKQSRWHLHLCVELQQILNLPEPPHFLVPAYTATVDRWLDPQTQKIETIAELYPAVRKHQALLSTVFETEDRSWRTASWQEELCNPIAIEIYRDRFPQLWENHDLLVRFESRKKDFPKQSLSSFSTEPENLPTKEPNRGYVLRLFISGNNLATESTLERIHQLLEQGLGHPYTLKVIDISKHPEQAETNQVSATPTLLRIWPQPVRRIVGELEDMERVLQILINS